MSLGVYKYLIPAYYDILSVVQVGGETLPVYDGMAPDTETGSYILIGERNLRQEDDKCGYTYTVDILVDVVIKNSSFGYKTADDYTNAITAEINSNTILDLSPEFQAVSTRIIQNFSLPGLNPTEPVFRSLVRFEHIITQVN